MSRERGGETYVTLSTLLSRRRRMEAAAAVMLTVSLYTHIVYCILLQNYVSVLSYEVLDEQSNVTVAHSLVAAANASQYAVVEEEHQDRRQPPIHVLEDEPGLPVFPQRPDAVYFIVAAVGGAKMWARTLAKTLLDLGVPFSSQGQGPVLRPVYLDMPQNGR